MPRKKKPEGRRKVTPELHEAITVWYANNPNQHAKASKEFGLSRRTLTKLFFEGYPPLSKPPIKTLIETVEIKARALRAQKRQEEIQQAQAELDRIVAASGNPELSNSMVDAAEARAHEGLMVAAARGNVVQVQQILAPILETIRKRIPAIQNELMDVMTPKQVLYFLREMSKFTNDINNAAKTVLEMERTLLGDPSAVIGDRNTRSPEQSQAILALAAKTYLRMQAEGRIVDADGVTVTSQALTKTPVQLPMPAAEDPLAGDFDVDAEDDEDDEDDDFEDDEPDDDISDGGGAVEHFTDE